VRNAFPAFEPSQSAVNAIASRAARGTMFGLDYTPMYGLHLSFHTLSPAFQNIGLFLLKNKRHF
jgi:hypothetical protein